MRESIFLDASWKLHDFAPGEGTRANAFTESFDDRDWIEVVVPGDVHRALIAAGRIADPYYGDNETQCAWVEEREWWYRVTFAGRAKSLAADQRLRLIFHGLDTFATIWLNGHKLGRHQNMFREAAFDVTEHLRIGQANTLALCFDRPLDHVSQPNISRSWEAIPERAFMRKAQFGYGWDWGPRLPTVGIWRPVELRRERVAIISGIHFRTLEIDASRRQALVAAHVEAERFGSQQPLVAQLRLTASSDQGEPVPAVEQTVDLQGNASRLDATIYLVVHQPHLWWTHDRGIPALYHLGVSLGCAGTVIDRQSRRVGIRTLRLDQSPDPAEPGTRFFRFVLNGVLLFAKGANWIPADSFVGAIPAERYTRLLSTARDANMNMLRVWGGGLYEHNIFYDMCDELGLLVWQDFMFACAMYPDDDPVFVAEIEAEAEYQIRRLRTHPCLALWCGNNENQWLHDQNYWDRSNHRMPGSRLYDDLLPRLVETYDGQTPYWPSSPFGGNDHNSMDEGDRHNWDVWHGLRPFRRHFGEPPRQDFTPEGVTYTNYAADLGRFISEFGMHAAPVRATLEQVIPPDQMYHHSPALDHHNKDNPKNKGDNLMLSVTGLPRDLDEYIAFSMIAQAEGLKFAIEHYRRRMPHCSGTLFWQLNDCWPCLSWSVLDYYGVGKAGYYYARRAYTPVLASFKSLRDGSVELWVTNDSLAEARDVAQVWLRGFDGSEYWAEEHPIAVAVNTSQKVYAWSAAGVSGCADRYLAVRSSTGQFPANRHFFAAIQNLQRTSVLPEKSIVQITPHELCVSIKASIFAYFVHLVVPHKDTRFSDNYFDLEAGETRLIQVVNDEHVLQPETIVLAAR